VSTPSCSDMTETVCAYNTHYPQQTTRSTPRKRRHSVLPSFMHASDCEPHKFVSKKIVGRAAMIFCVAKHFRASHCMCCILAVALYPQQCGQFVLNMLKPVLLPCVQRLLDATLRILRTLPSSSRQS